MRYGCVVAFGLALSGCAHHASDLQPVWVKPGATFAEEEGVRGQCLATAFANVPSAPAAIVVRPGYQTPVNTQCTALGNVANCTSSGGQYIPPSTIQYDANVSARSSVFQGCMYRAGFIMEQPVEPDDNGSEWTKGWKFGLQRGPEVSCADAARASGRNNDFVQGCVAQQNAYRLHR